MVCLCVRGKLQLVGTAQLLCQRHCTKSMKKYKENTELTLVIVVFIKDASNRGEQKEHEQGNTTSTFFAGEVVYNCHFHRDIGHQLLPFGQNKHDCGLCLINLYRLH